MAKRWTGPSHAQRRAQEKLAKALSQVGFALPGSLAVRSYRCGKANCACHQSPPRLHGPYIQWSRRLGGKTVHVNLSADQLQDYQPFFDNARRLRELVEQLESLTLTLVENDPRLAQPSTTTDRGDNAGELPGHHPNKPDGLNAGQPGPANQR
jgi:hypothetical protein